MIKTDRKLRITFWTALFLYVGCWLIHVIAATANLQAFADDSSIVFITHLNHTYMMGGNSQFIQLFSGGFPRDFQFLLNAAALQASLLIGVSDPQLLKYIFVGWEYALPSLLYAVLFSALYKSKNLAWGIFPLVSLALLSVSVDWNPVNSTRWAIPLFWMHLFIVLLAPRKYSLIALTAALGLGLAMLGGLYESVVAECGLAIALGSVLYLRERNSMPLLYALTAVPGSVRALFSLLGNNSQAPNSFHGIILPQALGYPYFSLVAAALSCSIILSLIPVRKQNFALLTMGCILLYLTFNMLWAELPPPWIETEMKYDYAVLSLVLMSWAAVWRILCQSPQKFAPRGAILALLVGSALWCVQLEQTQDWKGCRASYDSIRSTAPLWADIRLSPVLASEPAHGLLAPEQFGRCLWGQYTPWTDILLAPGGMIRHWTLLSFWQDFDFIEKNGIPALHTNGLALVSPASRPAEADLPLKTALYDLSPLYEKFGHGSLFPRTRCLAVEESDPYWQHHLLTLDDPQRRLMHVCSRSEPGSLP